MTRPRPGYAKVVKSEADQTKGTPFKVNGATQKETIPCRVYLNRGDKVSLDKEPAKTVPNNGHYNIAIRGGEVKLTT